MAPDNRTVGPTPGRDLLAPRGLQGIFPEVEVLIEGRDPGVADPHRVGLPSAPRPPPGPVSQIPGVLGRRETLKSRRVRETRIGQAGAAGPSALGESRESALFGTVKALVVGWSPELNL